jgi:hypothetical protein
MESDFSRLRRSCRKGIKVEDLAETRYDPVGGRRKRSVAIDMD